MEKLEMTQKVQFLSASMPLTKTYTHTPGGIEKTSYPHAYEFTSHEELTPDLTAFHAALIKHAALGHCLLKGNLAKPLISQSRAGSTQSMDTTHWLCFDIDGLPEFIDAAITDTATKQMKFTVDDFMNMIGLGNFSYILQWSASYGIENKAMRCHVMVMLTKPVPAPLIKQWLIHLNLTIDHLRNAQTLTKTGYALSWALDITACQNDKLIYIAPPVLKGVKNPLGRTPRISLVKKDLDQFPFPQDVNTAKNKALTDKRILELRAAIGLPAKKLIYKTTGQHEILSKPDTCQATDIRQERGFVYFNINGGDSWGYYHPEDNPDYIHNFKGEPIYLTKELLPDYWASLQQAGHRVSSDGLTYLAFCDRHTGTYYKGTYDAANDTLDITTAKTLIILQHFAKQYGMVIGDFVPEWELSFNPHDAVRVDFDNRTVNTFQLTKYMKAPTKKVTVCPPTIFKIIHHVLGSDADITEHFINWTAFALQERTRTLTSWVWHGTQGTGKGVLMNRILRPIFGFDQTTVRRMDEFKQPYNAYLKQCFMMMVDEVQTSQLLDEKVVAANLRNYITEPRITIRQMYAPPVECNNYVNIILSSNMPDPVRIPKEDRRTNVAKYQPMKLVLSEKDFKRIDGELQAFHDYLMNYVVDKVAASTPLETEDRNTLISISENAIDTISSALLEGNMELLLDQLPTSSKSISDVTTANKVQAYKETLSDLLYRTDALTGKVNIARDELRAIFEYTVGKMSESPNKFTALLKHHRIHVKKVWIDSKTVNGIATTFQDVQNFGQYLKDHLPAKAKTTP